jgi:diguanylate cyclase (GGDEF)-like protein/PAS domain S-box-containing protein
MLLGLYQAITRYQFLSIPSELITGELFNKLIGLNFLTNSEGNIIKANDQVYKLLGFQEGTLLGKHITLVLPDKAIGILMEDSEAIQDSVDYQEIYVPEKSGELLPFHITVIPLKIEKNLVRGFLFIGEDLRITKELIYMNSILSDKSVKDSLTNLYNHQYILEILEQKTMNALMDKTVFCLLMLDVDDFKSLNDRFGHLFGDKVLSAISELLAENIREIDFVGRYGGEEFIILLSDRKLDEAVVIAENMRQCIHDFNYGIEAAKVTISAGAAEYAGETAEFLINKADRLLYQAKRKGRNRVESKLE